MRKHPFKIPEAKIIEVIAIADDFAANRHVAPARVSEAARFLQHYLQGGAAPRWGMLGHMQDAAEYAVLPPGERFVHLKTGDVWEPVAEDDAQPELDGLQEVRHVANMLANYTGGISINDVAQADVFRDTYEPFDEKWLRDALEADPMRGYFLLRGAWGSCKTTAVLGVVGAIVNNAGRLLVPPRLRGIAADTPTSVLLITYRRTLVQKLTDDMRGLGVQVNNYLDIPQGVVQGQVVAIQLDSLPRLHQCAHFDVVIVDEHGRIALQSQSTINVWPVTRPWQRDQAEMLMSRLPIEKIVTSQMGHA